MKNLREAIRMAQERKPFKKKDLAEALWTESSPKAAINNLLNLVSGRSRSVRIDHIKYLCSYLNVSADYLLGINEEKKEKINDKITLINDTLADMREEIETL